jgi:creatinine amidohydrolase
VTGVVAPRSSLPPPSRRPMNASGTAPLPHRLKEMTPQQVAECLARDRRLIIPVGTCEQHGPHLPLGCDTIVVEHLADDLSAEFSVLRAPTFEYGVNADTERPAAGNAALRRKTLLRSLNDLTDSWESEGVCEFILLTAHGHQGHQEALASVVTHGARVRVVDIFGIRMDDLLETQRTPLHGDEVDTSLLLFIAPHLVRMESAQDYTVASLSEKRLRREKLKIPSASAGSIGTPSRATAAKGAAIYGRIRDRIRHRIFLTPAQE